MAVYSKKEGFGLIDIACSTRLGNYIQKLGANEDQIVRLRIELLAFHTAVFEKAEMHNLSMESAAYRVIEDIQYYNKLGGVKKELSDVTTKIFVMNQLSARQNNAEMALFLPRTQRVRPHALQSPPAREAAARRPPQNWEEYIDQEIEAVKSHFRHLKNAPDNYNWECAAGRKGIDPGRWYMQPKYVEIWVESANLQNTINVLKGDKMVKVAAFGGVRSTTHIHANCLRVKQWRDSHGHIEKVIKLYCGDFDSTGDWLDEYL